MQREVIILLTVRHLTDVMLLLQKETFLVEYDSVQIYILRLEMVQGRNVLVKFNIVGGRIFTFQLILQ